jgi:hypothetical protein
VYSSSQVPPVSGQEPIVSVTSIDPTTYTTYLTSFSTSTYCEPDPPDLTCVPTTLIRGWSETVIHQPLSFLITTIESEIKYSEVTATPIYSISSIPPGVVWASGIQIRWTGNYPINQSRGLTPGQKAGVSLGVIISFAIITVIVLWRIRLLRFKKRRLQATHDPVLEAAVEEPQIRDVSENIRVSERTQPYAISKVGAQEMRDEVADTGRHQNTGRLAQQAAIAPTTDSSMADTGSITSIKRKPNQAIAVEPSVTLDTTEHQTAVQAPSIDLEATGVTPTSLKDLLQPTVSVSEVLPFQSEEQQEQADKTFVAALSSTGEGSTSSQRDTLSDVGDEEGIRAELARVMERKQRVKELQRLKEEEETLERREEELLEKLKARGGHSDA